MGFSGSKRFKDLDGNEFHLEAKDRGVAVCSKHEMILSKEDAEIFGEELIFHASVVPDNKEQK